VTVRPLSETQITPEIWDRFVENADNGTVFHTRRFLAYHRSGRFDDHSLCVFDGDRLFAVISAATVKEIEGRAWVSHPGTSYGGPVLAGACRFHKAARLVETLTSYCRENGFVRMDLTLPPSSYSLLPHHTLEFALLRGGFGYRKRELTQVVDLADSQDPVTSLPAKTRADIRQAEKCGVRIRWTTTPSDEDLMLLHRMLCENRSQLGLSDPPTHSVDDLQKIRDHMPGMMWLGTGCAGDALVSQTLVFQCNPRVLLTFYICHERTARPLHPVHLLLADLMREGRKAGFRMLDFGISTVNGRPLHSLIRFKESFNGRSYFRDTFEMRL